MGVKLSEEGKTYMDKMRQKKGWKKLDREWQKKANVAESTLKRFWGEGVAPDTFKEICKAAGVDDLEKLWDLLVEGDKKDSTRVLHLTEVKEIYTLPSEASGTKFRITVRGIGIFDEDEQLLVKATLDDLVTFLDKSGKSRVNFSKAKEATTEPESPKAKFIITVNGVGILNEDEQLLARATLEELKGYLSRVYVWKMQPVCEME